MSMPKNASVTLWLSLAQALFHDLKPKDAGFEICGDGMKKNEFAFLVHRETKRVNEALISMSLAKNKDEVHRIFIGLSKDTLMALFSRWVHYFGAWKKMKNEDYPHLWIPPNQRDIWRAIFLAMTDDVPAASAACKQLWPEYFQG